MSNSPLWYVLDDDPGSNALIVQIDVFSGAGDAPKNLAEVQERAKDIQYASKTRFNTNRVKEIEALRSALRRVLEKLPAALRDDPDVETLAAVSQGARRCRWCTSSTATTRAPRASRTANSRAPPSPISGKAAAATCAAAHAPIRTGIARTELARRRCASTT